uniref:Zinc finger protein 99like [Pundamilia nyererei] n=1 Tax=Lepeophtheirus salmonis TaxID=72036 RepID=A0A0K2U926_LEPSM
MGSMDIMINKLFDKISMGASPYTEVVKKTLDSLWIGSAGVESSKIELTLTATVLINEICSFHDLPPSEIVIAEDALPLNTHLKAESKRFEEAKVDDLLHSTSNSSLNPSKVDDIEEFLLPPVDILCPVVDNDKPTITNAIQTLNPVSRKVCEKSNVFSSTYEPDSPTSEFLCNICKTLMPTYDKVLKHCGAKHPGLKVPVLKLVHGESMNAKQNYEIAQSTSSEELIFQCMHCQIDFKTEDELKAHIVAHDVLSSTTNKFNKLEVDKINKVGEESLTNEIGVAFLTSIIKCDHCDRVFTSVGSMKRHSLTAHPKYETPYECAKCNKRFRHCSSYLRHKVHTHGVGSKSLGGGGKPKPFKCVSCDKAWMYKYLLEEHNRIVHQGLKSTYSCDTCGKGFGRANNLKKHKDTVHATSFDFICDYCGKAYPIKQYLRTHIRDFHSDIPSVKELLETSRFKIKESQQKIVFRRSDPKKRYECDKCCKKFTHRSLLECHISNVHEGIKPYCCHLCGKSISTRANLRLHILRHDENRPKFICELCGKEFLNKQTLKEHVLYSHEKTPKEKNYGCEICGKKFWLRKELNKHIKLVHNKIYDYKCDICSRPFGTGTHLKTHKKTVHDKIYEYKCHLCSVEYGHQQSLKKHLVAVHDITDYMPPKKNVSIPLKS